MQSMPPNLARPADLPKSAARSIWSLAGVTLLAVVFFLSGLGNEPFADEYAYITQAYFTDLLIAGKTDDPAWLEYPAYDLPPLPKYLIGASLHVARIPLLARDTAFAWYHDINRRFGSQEMLIAARVPSSILGALGCLALFALGSLTGGRRAGWIAFLLLMVNPLYGLHARRAMSDVPCEAFILASLVAGLWGWVEILRGRWHSYSAWMALTLAGLFGGFALLCKFNGLLTVMVIAAWGAIGLAFSRRHLASIATLGVGPLGIAFLVYVTFLGLNPFMTARPTGELSAEAKILKEMDSWERFRFQMKHRTGISDGQQKLFTHNALISPIEKIKVVTVQGFGRFGPFGKHGWSSEEKTSERRYDWSQDWGAVIWGPLVIAGFATLVLVGLRQYRRDEIPTSWAIAAWAVVTFGVVTVYIPMAWDRYLLPIQSVSCLMVAVLLSEIWKLLGRWLVPHPDPGASEA